jgi:chitosanase
MQQKIKEVVRKIINCFENGKAESDYSSVYIYKDGPKQVRQITLGFGITQYGNMRRLLELYKNDGGIFSDKLSPYITKMESSATVNDKQFIANLQKAAREDAIMRAAEDKVYEEVYLKGAIKFCEDNGFVTPLGFGVIQDTFIQSGSLLNTLKSRVDEKFPKQGGDEKVWLQEYCKVRRNWLANHSRTILHGTVYRMDFFLKQIAAKNWDLVGEMRPNGVKISNS